MAENFSDWLSRDSHRVVLFEAEYATSATLIYWNSTGIPLNSTEYYMNSSYADVQTGVVYFSTSPYVTQYNDTFLNVSNVGVVNIAYDDAISGTPEIVGKLNQSSTIGQIQILNNSGEYDYILPYAWEGHPFRLLLGDRNWYRSEFVQVFEGTLEKVTAPSINTIQFSIKDKRESLDVELQEELLTEDYILNKLKNSAWADINTTDPVLIYSDSSVNALVPICLGKCFNIEPVLISISDHIYIIHEGPIDAVTEVRSNGVILDISQYKVDLNNGLLRLLSNPDSTQITCDVIGTSQRPYGTRSEITDDQVTDYSIPALLEYLLLNKTTLIGTDLCWQAWNNFPYKSYEVGYYSKSQETVLSVCEKLMASVGGFIRFDRSCVLQILVLEDPELISIGPLQDSVTLVDEDSMIEFGISLQDTEMPNHGITVGYRKNWTVQDKASLAGSVPVELGLGLAYSTDYSKVSVNIPDVKPIYPTAKDTGVIETLLYNKADAIVEMGRRKGIRSIKRFIYKVESTAIPFVINIGDVVEVQDERFGFNLGKRCILIGTKENLLLKQVDIEVWR